MQRGYVYKCDLCGNIVQVLHGVTENLTCCGAKMKHLVESSTDAALEKHVPVIEKTANGYKVSVGSVAHPMTAEHYIEWIELVADGKSYFQFLTPNDKPEAEFCVNASNVSAREYCNLHSLWKNK